MTHVYNEHVPTEIPENFAEEYPNMYRMQQWILKHGVRFKTTPMVTAAYEVTPELIKECLEYVSRYGFYNRPLTQSGLNAFCTQIKEGKMRCTHQGISFGPLMNLTDGNTRFNALLKQGTSLEMQVSINVPDEYFPAFDNGKSRPLEVRASTAHVRISKITAKRTSALLLMMRLTNSGGRRDSDTCRIAHQLIRPMESKLHESPSRYFGRSPVAAAALSYIGTEHEEYVTELYNECAVPTIEYKTPWPIRDAILQILRKPKDKGIEFFTEQKSSLSDFLLFNRMCLIFHPTYGGNTTLPSIDELVPNSHPIVKECRTNLFKLFSPSFPKATLAHCLYEGEDFGSLHKDNLTWVPMYNVEHNRSSYGLQRFTDL